MDTHKHAGSQLVWSKLSGTMMKIWLSLLIISFSEIGQKAKTPPISFSICLSLRTTGLHNQKQSSF